LIEAECNKSLADFAREIGRSDAQVNHLVGPSPIKGIGDAMARHIENKFGKPRGWLDNVHSPALSASAEWVATVFDRLDRVNQENFVSMLRGPAERVAPELMDQAPTFHNKNALTTNEELTDDEETTV